MKISVIKVQPVQAINKDKQRENQQLNLMKFQLRKGKK